ncbi:hypothetical protein D3C78_851870 [compost metagenome]
MTKLFCLIHSDVSIFKQFLCICCMVWISGNPNTYRNIDLSSSQNKWFLQSLNQSFCIFHNLCFWEMIQNNRILISAKTEMLVLAIR